LDRPPPGLLSPAFPRAQSSCETAPGRRRPSSSSCSSPRPASPIRSARRANFDYTAALILDPKDADAYRERGLVQARTGNLDKAIADLEQALKLQGQ
jgi:hypothetical protein